MNDLERFYREREIKQSNCKHNDHNYIITFEDCGFSTIERYCMNCDKGEKIILDDSDFSQEELKNIWDRKIKNEE